MQQQKAPDVAKDLRDIVKNTPSFGYVKISRVKAFRSFKSTSRARARIWSFPKIWQDALDLPPHYVLEVLSEKYDHLSREDQLKVLIHELLHIPKNFSGALRPHKARNWKLDHRLVNTFWKEYIANK